MTHRPALARALVSLLFVLVAPRIATATDAVAHGEQVYGAFCEKCHGVYGRGDGPALAYFTAKPPDLTSPAVLGSRSADEVVAGLLARGKDPQAPHSLMAFASFMKQDDLRDAVAYMKSLATPAGGVSLAAGRDIYTSVCWVCHGLEGKGDGPAAASLTVKPRNFTASTFSVTGREEEVYRTISEGAAKSLHGSESMISWKGSLAPQQIRDVMAYIATFKSPPAKKP
jgi:mono/diheme cytochrome c family protein